MNAKILVILFASMFLCSGCILDEVTEDKPQTSISTERHDTELESGQVIIDKHVEAPREIKIAEVLDSANSELWLIYLHPTTVEFETKNPPQFRCRVRITTATDEAIKTIELNPRLDTYEFFMHDGEPYYRCVNHFGWKSHGKVKGAVFAERIYNYVSHNI